MKLVVGVGMNGFMARAQMEVFSRPFILLLC